ncbi:MAG: MMPL family transporter [Deltaproteobacteria bacterium]|nr:MMPL family transporter [Deltaproteobacteria bacterium]
MRDRFLRRLSEIVIASPGRVLLLALVLGVAAALTVPFLNIDAGHSALFDSKDIHHQRFKRFLNDFGSPDVLFALVQGGNAETRREVIDALRKRLPQREKKVPDKGASSACLSKADRAPGCVRDIVGRFELGSLRPYGLIYLSKKSLKSLVSTLSSPDIGLRKISEINDLAALFSTMASEVDRRAQVADEPMGKAMKSAEFAMRLFERFIGELDLRARDDARAKVTLADAFLETLGKKLKERLQRSGIDTHGYLVSRDGKLHLALIRPANGSDEPGVVVAFVRYVQRIADTAAAEVARRHGDATKKGVKGTQGTLRVTLTGLPALIKAEKETLNRDLMFTSAVAAIGILLIFIFGFRSLRQGILGLLPLSISVIWTLAFVWAVYGGLNLVTSAFLPTVFGLGIDFAVHLLSRYNEARRKGSDAADAARAAITRAGPGMLTSGLTTAGAFLALTVNEFKGFIQLGTITAVGLLFSLFAALTIGVALLVHPRLTFLQKVPKERQQTKDGGGESMRFANAIMRHRWLVLGSAVLISAVMVWRGQSIPWSYDYLKLLPTGSPAVKAMHTLATRTDYSGEVAAIRAPDAATAIRMVKALRQKKTVGRVESLAPYIPTDQQAKEAIIAKLRPLYAKLDATRGARNVPAAPASSPSAMPASSPSATPASSPSATPALAAKPLPLLTVPGTHASMPPAGTHLPPIDITKFRASVTELIDNLQDARFAAKGGGKDRAALLLKTPIDALNALQKTLAKLPVADTGRRLARFQHSFFKRWHEGQALLRQGVFAGSISAKKFVSLLPGGLRTRLYSHGAFAIYVYPKQWLWAPGFLKRFIDDLRAVDPAATGWPVTHWEANLMIERGFHTASLLTGLALFFLLFVDFRSLRYTLLAIAPVLVGMMWMWGGISVLGMSYNFANIIGFPLVIGIGVASGVHILHRYRQEGEHHVAPVVHHTGLAVFLSALTTMAGFGSLALARHQGMSSLGVVLLLGVTSCLLTATVVLPALLAALDREPRR